jgi:glycine/D-amino acid oxidase-like deaminating enzyme
VRAHASEILVLGAGLQGVCAALALSRAGHRVTMIDRETDCLMRASLHNEGKIHLGFVYANDTTCRTSSLMLEAALSFGPLLEAWIGMPIPWSSYLARPFTYLVLRDSLVPACRLFEAWERLASTYRERHQEDAASYFGTRPSQLWSCATKADPLMRLVGERVSHAAHTAELALDMPAFRRLLSARLRGTAGLRCLFNHDVKDVERVSGGFRVSGIAPGGTSWTHEAAAVVNCLWEGRLAIDRQLGLLPARPWVHRLKCRMLGQLPERLADLPSLTLMCGRFGDVVNFGGGRVYLSWYPTCLRGWSTDVEVPAAWDSMSRGDPAPVEAEEIITRSLEAFDTVIPGLADSRIDSVAAGVIFSWGKTDIDDPASELHRRDDIGPAAFDGYITVNTGKLTTAPLFAQRIVQLLA